MVRVDLRRLGRALVWLLGAVGLAATPACAQQAPPASEPSVKAAFAPHAMVAAANPLAVAAGVKVLKAGGTAIDAAVAVQAVLGLVEPQSSGVGGGAYLVYYDARTHKTTAYDGREIAPAGAGPDLFLGPGGKPLGFFDAVLSGRSTGVPGAIAMLSMAQHDHGVKPWKDLFADGERLATVGFVVTPRLSMFIHSRIPQAVGPDAAAYFSKPDGTRLSAGDVLKNPAYAKTLGRIAAEGPSALLSGQIAQDIVDRTHQGDKPGALTLADFAAYSPHRGEALCRPYRVYVVCTPADPSGGAALLEGLGILEHTDIATRGPSDPQAWFEFAQASRLMYADRDYFIGDPAFVSVPTPGLLASSYEAARARLIGQEAGPAPAHGAPAGALARAADATPEPGGTSHMVIVDAQGDVLSMTTTVESIFGSGRMVDGFFLNNQLTDFSFNPKTPDGLAAANAPGPHKRPRSSMAPAIVFDAKGRFVVALGSPGGPAILAYNLKALVGFLDWKLPLPEALALPNLIAHGDGYIAEVDKFPPGVAQALAARGMKLQHGFGEDSGLHGVARRPDGLEGGADPRREGVAQGF
ncbi:MAG TPA: gamma-glutamyltransferase family protein [Caulobacteraceae bacterium]